MSFVALPATAAFAHHDARSGFEVVYFESSDSGCRIDGSTAAVEDGQTWIVDYRAMSGLDGCLDVDLESSAMTNALRVRRMSLATGERAEAPATYVRAIDLSVERLDQTYQRADDDGPRSCYDYPKSRSMRSFARFGITAVHHDARALGCEECHDRRTNLTGAAGDQNNQVLQAIRAASPQTARR